jgi:hypothetical protein
MMQRSLTLRAKARLCQSRDGRNQGAKPEIELPERRSERNRAQPKLIVVVLHFLRLADFLRSASREKLEIAEVMVVM